MKILSFIYVKATLEKGYVIPQEDDEVGTLLIQHDERTQIYQRSEISYDYQSQIINPNGFF